MTESDIAADLERFVYDNPDLERLEAILDQFNPFAALRWTRQEARHSSFLRWILDPSETHGFGPYFLTGFLKRVAHRASRSDPGAPNVFDVDSWDLSTAEVHQEWESIDILVQSETDNLVTVIENKIDSSEHSDQLRRYRATVEQHFPEARKLFVYLTTDGVSPSDDRYVPMNHAELAELVSDAVERRGSQLSDDVAGFLGQYVDMVRRYIVEDSEIQELSRSLYQKHRRALDTIFEHRPDKAQDVYHILIGLIEDNDHLTPDISSKSYVRFIPKTLDFIPLVGDGWTRTKRLFLFEFGNYDGMLNFKVQIGPGDPAIRQRLYDEAAKHPRVFGRRTQKLSQQFHSVHIEKWLTKKRYAELTAQEIGVEMQARLARFVDGPMSKMVAALMPLRDVFSPGS